MSEMNWENMLIFLGVVVVTAGVAFALFLGYRVSQDNSKKEQNLQQECIEAHGTYIVKTGCIMPTVAR